MQCLHHSLVCEPSSCAHVWPPLRNGDSIASVYYCKMKGFTDEMGAAGKPLEDEDFVSHMLAGLDHDYNSFVENSTGKDELSLGTLYSGLLATESRLDLQSSQSQSSVNVVVCGRGGY
jgi:hypothetical protein